MIQKYLATQTKSGFFSIRNNYTSKTISYNLKGKPFGLKEINNLLLEYDGDDPAFYIEKKKEDFLEKNLEIDPTFTENIITKGFFDEEQELKLEVEKKYNFVLNYKNGFKISLLKKGKFDESEKKIEKELDSIIREYQLRLLPFSFENGETAKTFLKDRVLKNLNYIYISLKEGADEEKISRLKNEFIESIKIYSDCFGTNEKNNEKLNSFLPLENQGENLKRIINKLNWFLTSNEGHNLFKKILKESKLFVKNEYKKVFFYKFLNEVFLGKRCPNCGEINNPSEALLYNLKESSEKESIAKKVYRCKNCRRRWYNDDKEILSKLEDEYIRIFTEIKEGLFRGVQKKYGISELNFKRILEAHYKEIFGFSNFLGGGNKIRQKNLQGFTPEQIGDIAALIILTNN